MSIFHLSVAIVRAMTFYVLDCEKSTVLYGRVKFPEDTSYDIALEFAITMATAQKLICPWRFICT